MKIDPLVLLKAFFNPTFIKLFLILIFFTLFAQALKTLINRKIKNFKPKKAASSTLVIVAIVSFVIMILLFKFL